MITLIDPLLSLFFLMIIEIILGVDNLIFLAILTERLPADLRRKVRSIGLTGAWVLRLALLFSALWMTKISSPLFNLGTFTFSVREIFFILGGLFLVFKSSKEITGELELLDHKKPNAIVPASKTALSSLVIQVMLMDLVFSLDSVLTAIGLTKLFMIMAIAITFSIIAMYFLSDWVAGFIHKHPSIKMLALAFLVMIGMFLIADGFHYEIPRGYLYFAMFFSFSVEILNLINRNRIRKK